MRWLDQRFEPTISGDPAPSCVGKLQDAEIYHQILEHRWFLSEREGRDVPMDEASTSYIDDVLRHAPDEQVRIDARPAELFLGLGRSTDPGIAAAADAVPSTDRRATLPDQ